MALMVYFFNKLTNFVNKLRTFVNYTTHSCVYFLVNFLLMGMHGVVSPSLFFCVKFCENKIN